MKKLLLYAFLFVSILTGCKKSNDEAPDPVFAPASGIVTGTISPRSATVLVTAIGQGVSYSATPDTATGVFKLQGMSSGTYVIRFNEGAVLYSRPDTTLQVTTGQTINLGSLVFKSGTGFTGTAGPGSGIYSITFTNTQSGDSIRLNQVSGMFTTSQLRPGPYRISFSTVFTHKPPPDLFVILAAGQVFDLGAVTGLPNMLSLSPLVGVPVLQSYAAPILTIESRRANFFPSTNNMGGTLPDWRFKLVMDNITAVGTFQCLNTATSGITYTEGNQTWSTSNAGGSGTVVVTSIDPVKKEIKGTITATLVSSTAGTANVSITNGSFYFAY